MTPSPPPDRLRPGVRAVLVTVASAVVPGLGHLGFRLGSRRVAAVLLALSLAGIAVTVVWGLSLGTFGVLAVLVTPGMLAVAFAVNVVVAAWRAVIAVDALRRTRPSLAAAVASAVVLVLAIGVPHLILATDIASTSDFLDSMFAGVDATPGPIADASATPDTSTEPPTVSPTDGTASPGASGAPSPSPTYEIGPYPTDGGNGTLPAFDAAVPWTRPGVQPWGDDGRFDMLLIGSDAGTDRWSRRTDVMLLVEVDVNTGAVAMIGLPRNLQNAPYPPGAARDASACGCQTGLLNEMYVEATARHPDLWPGKGAVKGIGAVRSVVSEITGRPIDAVLIVDLEGVIRVVDAMGGIDINVPAAVHDDHYPDPGHGDIVLDIHAGKQHFDGRTALAYARSRHQDSDYGRMDRQQTLLLAIRDQLGPTTILQAPALFGAAKGAAWTDLPRESLPALVELFGKAEAAKVKQLRVVPPAYPSWLTAAWVTQIRLNVAALLPGTDAPARSSFPRPVAPRPTPTPSPTPRPTARPTASPSATAPPGESPTPEPSATAPPEPTPTPQPPTPTPEPTPTPTP